MKALKIAILFIFVPILALCQEIITKDIIVERLAGSDPAKLGGSITFTGDSILFDYGSAKLRPESHKQLMEIAAALNDERLAFIPYFFVDGHTCDKSSDAFNCRLSIARANSVTKYLIEKGGVPKEKIKPRGFGERIPEAPNDSEENRKKNRRVVLKSGYLELKADEEKVCSDRRNPY